MEVNMIYEYISTTDYNGHEQVNFKLNGRNSLVVRPKKALDGNPVIWRTEFFGCFDWVDKALLEKGWHLAYHSASDMYGCPESLEMLREFQDFTNETFGLAKKAVLEGLSRGGLYAVNYAAKYPERVKGIYLDAPVLDIRSWPCCYEDSREKKECLEWYHLTPETLKNFKGNPLDKSELIADKPILIIAGAADTVVPWKDNGAKLVEKLEALHANYKLILKPDCDHHPHSISEPAPAVEFIEKM